MKGLWSALAVLAACCVLHAGNAAAQAHGLTAKPLLRSTVSGDDTKETIVALGELAPGGTTGRHTHPGDEYATVLEGAVELRMEGQPPRRVGAGEAYHNARGIVHETVNVGATPVRLLSTFVVEKGKPFLEPAK